VGKEPSLSCMLLIIKHGDEIWRAVIVAKQQEPIRAPETSDIDLAQPVERCDRDFVGCKTYYRAMALVRSKDTAAFAAYTTHPPQPSGKEG